jgi:hypothetical protein
MVVRETTKGIWKEVVADEQNPLAYFANRFLKPSKKKNDPTPTFTSPPPQLFGLVFQRDLWDNLTVQADQDVRKIASCIVADSDVNLIAV